MSATYGVTSSTLAEYARLDFSGSTSPTSTEADAHISRLAKRVDGRLESMGYTASSIQGDSTHVLYSLAADWISCEATARLLMARRGASSQQVEALRDEAGRLWESIISHPQDAGSDTLTDFPGRWGGETTRALTSAEKLARSLGQRLVDEREL